MLKLMIVDDEFFIRKGIINSIEWSEYDIEICGEASNGAEALSLIEQVHPNCVLTDIRMNEMNGLEFIEHAQQIDQDIVFVILSGYDDFEYARKAISLGVSEYLLKPISAEELVDTMLQIKAKINKASELLSNHDSSLQNSMMLSWNTPDITPLSIDTSFFRVFAFRVDNIADLSAILSTSKDKISANTIPSIVEEYLDLAKINHIVKASDDDFYIVILNYKKSISHFTDFLNCFIDYLKEKNNIDVVIGCGQEYMGYRNINQSYNEAFAALAFHYQKTDMPVIYSDSIPASLLRDYMYNPLLQNFKFDIKLLSDFSKLTFEQYFSKTDALFNKIANHSLPFREIKTLFLKICVMNLNRLTVPAHNIAQHLNLSGLIDYNCTSLSELQPQVKNLYHQIKDFQQRNAEDNSHYNAIDIIMQYVHTHYGEDISLNLLSQKVHVTPNYLSKLFKDNVGENFKEWLTQYRIEKSKEFLADPALKVYEIASMVGFSDYKHFAAVFKKYVGYSAKEYRILTLKSNIK